MRNIDYVIHYTRIGKIMLLLLLSGQLLAADNIIMTLGDSLSSGYGLEQGKSWVNLLENKLQQQQSEYILVNESISGDTTANGLNRLSGGLERHQPKIVIVELGGNDGLRGLSISHIKSNLQQIIKQCLDANARILLVGIQIPPNYGKKYTDKFTAIYPDLAAMFDIPLIPFLLSNVAGNEQLMQIDGIHPNARAQPIIMENVWEQLEPMLK